MGHRATQELENRQEVLRGHAVLSGTLHGGLETVDVIDLTLQFRNTELVADEELVLVGQQFHDLAGSGIDDFLLLLGHLAGQGFTDIDRQSTEVLDGVIDVRLGQASKDRGIDGFLTGVQLAAELQGLVFTHECFPLYYV